MPEQTITLPLPSELRKDALSSALKSRRSVRSFVSGSLDTEQVSVLLFAAQGVTHPRGLRTAPSAGALYPLELYLAAGEVADVPPGVYKYEPKNHRLRLVREGDARQELVDAALGQSWMGQAQCMVAVCAVYARVTGKYGARGEQYVHFEAGHAAQNLALQAVDLGLGTTVVGAFRDGQVQQALGAPDQEVPLMLLPVGIAGNEHAGSSQGPLPA
jgi:SagB-type dehydrogenase family enzyme